MVALLGWTGAGRVGLGDDSMLAAAAASPTCGSLGTSSAWALLLHIPLADGSFTPCPDCAAGISVHFW